MSTPSDYFEIVQDGEKREIFMSFGLLNEITTLMGEPATAASVYFDPELRVAVLGAALHERTKSGKIAKEVDMEEIVIAPADIEALLAWEVEHAIAFFSRSMERVFKMKGQLEELNKATSSLNGSPGSHSKKQSSGR